MRLHLRGANLHQDLVQPYTVCVRFMDGHGRNADQSQNRNFNPKIRNGESASEWGNKKFYHTMCKWEKAEVV